MGSRKSDDAKTDPDWPPKDSESDSETSSDRPSTPETDPALDASWFKQASSTLKSCSEPKVGEFKPGVAETKVGTGRFDYVAAQPERDWSKWLLVFCVVVSLVLNSYQLAREEVRVYLKEPVIRGCKDYLAAPITRCEEAMYLEGETCVCIFKWVAVDDPVVRQMVIDGRSSRYLVAWWEMTGLI